MADAPMDHAPPPRTALLKRLGLHRSELRAWALYDLANSAMYTLIIAAVFPPFFRAVAAAELSDQHRTAWFGFASAVSIIVAAAISPVLGAMADYTPVKKRLLALFMVIGVISVACMFFIYHGAWALAVTLFILANIGATASFVFYDALLPHVARDNEMDRVSTAGFALGYIGGGLLLGASLMLIASPHWFGLPSGENLTPAQETLPVRIAFVAVAVWWLAFSVPLFIWVREPAPQLEADERAGQNPIRAGFGRLADTFAELRKYKPALILLLAYLIYSDGIGTIIRMAAIYGEELGIEHTTMIAAILLTQFVGIPCAFGFGMLAGRIGAKTCIFIGLFVYMGITILGFLMTSALHFFMLAGLVGLVQGGTQALSRSLFASMIPRYKSGEFFGFFGVIDRFSGFMGTGLMALLAWWTGTGRYGILAVILFFIVGTILLKFVDVEEGRATARGVERRVTPRAAFPVNLKENGSDSSD